MKFAHWIIGGIFLIYFVLLILPLFKHSLNGVFVSPQETREYTQLDSFLAARPEFYRTLWIPSVQRFGLYSENHPVISQTDILPKLKTVSDLEKYQLVIQEMAIKYVVVPDDSSEEIFLTDRKYDEKKYIQTISEVKKISWLKQTVSFGKIIVFENTGARNQFFSNSTDAVVSYTKKNPTEYTVKIQNGHKGDMIVFSSSYDTNWTLRENRIMQQSKPFDKLFNSFVLQKDGNQTVEIMYGPQKWVSIGLVISIIALSVFLVLLFRVR